MHMSCPNRSALAFVSVTLAILGNAWGQQPATQPGTTSSNGLVVSVQPLKKAYELGEEILLSVTVSNASHRAIKLIRTGGLVGSYRPVVKDVGGNTVSFTADGQPEQRGATRSRARAQSMRLRFELAPTEALTCTVSLDQWVRIEHAGSYELTLLREQTPSLGSALSSNTIKIDVLPKRNGRNGAR